MLYCNHALAGTQEENGESLEALLELEDKQTHLPGAGDGQRSPEFQRRRKDGSHLQQLRRAFPMLKEGVLRQVLAEATSFDEAVARALEKQDLDGASDARVPVPGIRLPARGRPAIEQRQAWNVAAAEYRTLKEARAAYRQWAPLLPARQPVAVFSRRGLQVEAEELAKQKAADARMDAQQEGSLAVRIKQDQLAARYPSIPPAEVHRMLTEKGYRAEEAWKPVTCDTRARAKAAHREAPEAVRSPAPFHPTQLLDPGAPTNRDNVEVLARKRKDLLQQAGKRLDTGRPSVARRSAMRGVLR